MFVNHFIVMPGGISFPTSDLDIPGGDKNHAFFNAHKCAAQQAAERRAPSYVLRADTGSARLGFGPHAFFSSTSVLYQIMRLGLNSVWDYGSCSWLPLSEEIAEEERKKELVIVR